MPTECITYTWKYANYKEKYRSIIQILWMWLCFLSWYKWKIKMFKIKLESLWFVSCKTSTRIFTAKNTRRMQANVDWNYYLYRFNLASRAHLTEFHSKNDCKRYNKNISKVRLHCRLCVFESILRRNWCINLHKRYETLIWSWARCPTQAIYYSRIGWKKPEYSFWVCFGCIQI